MSEKLQDHLIAQVLREHGEITTRLGNHEGRLLVLESRPSSPGPPAEKPRDIFGWSRNQILLLAVCFTLLGVFGCMAAIAGVGKELGEFINAVRGN